MPIQLDDDSLPPSFGPLPPSEPNAPHSIHSGLPGTTGTSRITGNGESISTKLQSILVKMLDLYRQAGFGTLLVLFISFILWLIHLSMSRTLYGKMCLDASSLLGLFSIHRHLGYALLSDGIFPWLVASIVFPLTASTFERQVGTLKFIYLFFVFGIVTALLFIPIVFILSSILSSIVTIQTRVGGLDIPFLTFLTVQAMSIKSFENQDDSSKFAYPIASLLLIQFFLYTSSVFIHLFAIVTGYLFLSGILDVVIPSTTFFVALESARIFIPLTNSPLFVGVNGNQEFGASAGASNRFYNPIGDNESLLRAEPDVEQLWDDVEAIPSTAK